MGKSKYIEEQNVEWIGNYYDQPYHDIKEVKFRTNILFYKKCHVDNLTISLGDCVMIANDEYSDDHSFTTCYIGKVRYLYEDLEMNGDKCRALVKWYSRTTELQKEKKLLWQMKDSMKQEVVEDDRASGDIAVDSIFAKCEVITNYDSLDFKPNRKTFYCRSKIVYEGNKYKVVPFNNIQLPITPNKIKLTKVPSTEDIWRVVTEADNKENVKISPRKRMQPIHEDHEDEYDTKKIMLNNGVATTPSRKSSRRSSLDSKSLKSPLVLLEKLELQSETPTKRNTRRSLSEEKEFKKTVATPKRLPAIKEESNIPTTPKSSKIPARRRSCLKTPGENPGTPRRSVNFKTVVEERHYDKNEGTPSSRKSKNEVTPKRKIILEEPGTPLEIARRRLHVSAVPQSLPCRENEFKEIFDFLENKIEDETSGCMYISGVPGTGKTATVTRVIRTLQEEHNMEFEFVEINGMRITEPKKAYSEICKKLMNQNVSPEQACNLLEKRFNSKTPRRSSTVLLVDELDILCNKRQDVVYNLLNWPTNPTSRLIVITIANTMDLPERVLMGKVASRLGLTRLTFKPYSHKNLQDIVTARLYGLESFNNDAIQLVARKVAALSGDARRALDICRRATEIAEMGLEDKSKAYVSMVHVQQALTEMISCVKVRAVKSCSKIEKLYLQAVCAEVLRTGLEEVSFRGVFDQIKNLLTINGLMQIPTGKVHEIGAKLNAMRLIICEHSRTDLYQKILLNISSDDVYYATTQSSDLVVE